MRFVLGLVLFLSALFICLSSYAGAPDLSETHLPSVQWTCVSSETPLRVNVGTFPHRTGRFIETLSFKNFRPQDYQMVSVRFESEEDGVRKFTNHPIYLSINTIAPSQDGWTSGKILLYGMPYKLRCQSFSRY